MPEYKIRILHLYPDLLNLYGDKGNIECMRKRLEWRGIDVEVISRTQNDDGISISDADIIFLGGGQELEQKLVCHSLLKEKQELETFVNSGGTILAVCGGYYILGKSYQLGEDLEEGLGILDITTKIDSPDLRMIGDAVIECDGIDSKIVGFENHTEKTDIGSLSPFGKVIKGFGNDEKCEFEGVSYKNLIGTNLHGPLLPKNPMLCDMILNKALKHKYPDFEGLIPIDDELENFANRFIQSRI